jgi:hypothetical protein
MTYVKRAMEHRQCVVCGFADTRALQWHHDKDLVEKYGAKVAGIARLVNAGAPIGKIRVELKKCVVMCANCHSIHHANEREEHRVRKERNPDQRRG